MKSVEFIFKLNLNNYNMHIKMYTLQLDSIPISHKYEELRPTFCFIGPYEGSRRNLLQSEMV